MHGPAPEDEREPKMLQLSSMRVTTRIGIAST